MPISMLDKLIEISSEPLGPPIDLSASNGLRGEWLQFLSRKNGFYAFESALLVRPKAASMRPGLLEADKWNEPSCWRDAYDFDLSKLFFFAEDVFGGQFAISEAGIVSFDPETAECKPLAATFEEW